MQSGTLFSLTVPFLQCGAKIVPPRALFYGRSNSTLGYYILVLFFFLSVGLKTLPKLKRNVILLVLFQVWHCTSSKVRKFEKEIREKPHEFESWDAGLGAGQDDYYEDYDSHYGSQSGEYSQI